MDIGLESPLTNKVSGYEKYLFYIAGGVVAVGIEHIVAILLPLNKTSVNTIQKVRIAGNSKNAIKYRQMRKRINRVHQTES